MNIAIAQTKYRTGDFEFNFKSIADKVSGISADLIIFPTVDLYDIGGKDLLLDEKVQQAQIEFYDRLAEQNFKTPLLIGDILIKDGNVLVSEDGFFDINGENIYVSDEYSDDVICDLYVLAKNSYFAIGKYKEFVESINTNNNFVYINAIGLADENVFAGGSFAKNRENEIVFQAPLCTELTGNADFNTPVEFTDEPMEQQVIDVTTFALNEYCAINGIKKVVLGLSGGIDSALTAVLAAKALGAENVLGIMMPSMYSSQGSVLDSVELAQNLGIRTEKHTITPLFENFMEKVAHEQKGDLAEENLQARLRALILMFFSNRGGYLLLSTGNKSESAMGFGTLYGDLAGGYNLICDLTKTNVYKVSNYINKDEEVIPQAIIDKAPSAELHPGQKDQDRLPEYAVLDDVLEMYFEQNKPLDEIYAKYNKPVVDEIVRKTYRMAYKRKQCCLGVRLTERSFLNGIDLPIVQRYY